MRHLGKKPSATLSQQLSQGDTVSLADGDAIWLLPDKYKHVVRFSDVVNISRDAKYTTSRKRSAVDDVVASSTEPLRKRHSSASVMSTDSSRINDEICDEEQSDTDVKHLESVCELYAFDRLIIMLLLLLSSPLIFVAFKPLVCVTGQGRRNRSGRPGGCRTNNFLQECRMSLRSFLKVSMWTLSLTGKSAAAAAAADNG